MLLQLWRKALALEPSRAFDLAGDFYSASRIPVIALNEVFLAQELKEFSLAGKTAIDVGCGPGNSTAALLAAGARFVHCVDSSPKMLALNQARHGASGRVQNHLVETATERPCLDGSAQVLVFSQTLGFLKDPAAQIAYYSERIGFGGRALVLRIAQDVEDTGAKPLVVDPSRNRRIWVRHYNRSSAQYQRIFEENGWELSRRAFYSVSDKERPLIPVSDAQFSSQFLGRRVLESLHFIKGEKS